MPIDEPTEAPDTGGGTGSGGGGTTPPTTPTTPGCDLRLVSATPTNPTAPGGFGYVTFVYTTETPYVVGVNVYGPVSRSANYPNTGEAQVTNLTAGRYQFAIALVDSSCLVEGDFTISEPVPAVDPSLGDPARWEPVGGVLPNPVLLKVEASLTDAGGAARAGLHVELELWRPAALAAFASFRATVRTASQLVDAAPWLREQLVAAARYPATSSAPLVDNDAALRFTYRYRVADSVGPEQWLTRAGERYAVLAALPAATDTMAPFVADGTGRVASIFADDEATQFVGYPLDVSVLLPPADTTRYAEWRYLDAQGQEIQIRAYALASTLLPGVLRIPLPASPPLAAASVEVAIVDTDRSYTGTSPAPTPGYLLTNTGRLRL